MLLDSPGQCWAPYWVSSLPLTPQGIDFAMTALVCGHMRGPVEGGKDPYTGCHRFYMRRTVSGVIRSSNFILPALAAAVAMLLFLRRTVEQKMEED